MRGGVPGGGSASRRQASNPTRKEKLRASIPAQVTAQEVQHGRQRLLYSIGIFIVLLLLVAL